ncbi:hypothetical protein SAMN05216262_101567 [Colwellia chukchiensis]|uniref:Uncharacterized protein n=1 Tax=Colwellia chukchiensis TaxID=641665 RepID=A0A1H7HQ07_9GAMM|nr:hypothetical protein [Colwellia chukchiensis]SEK52361.1 hypothetical protein SAMN05216262_101567 [Colwellia chukchiensis]
MTFIVKVLFIDIILGWGSVILFWLAAVYFCFSGTKSYANIWQEKMRALSHFFIGLPFFIFFYLLIKINGVPEYIVYDHVQPHDSKYGSIYPAVKLHPIFQFSQFEQAGVITEDLSKFVASTDAFDDFKVKRIEHYPSIAGYVSYVNEIAILGLFFLWYVLINRLHNSLATISLYRRAIADPKISHYQDYLEASQPVRMLQPFKRKKARKALANISQIYNKQLTNYLALLNQKNPQPIYDSLIAQIRRCKSYNPTLNVDVVFKDLATKAQIKQLDDAMDYGSDHTLPSAQRLSNGFSSILSTALNNFLNEDYIVPSSITAADIQIKLPLKVVYQKDPLTYIVNNVEKTFTWVAFFPYPSADANSFEFAGYMENRPIHSGKFGVDKWQEVASACMAKTLLKKFLQNAENSEISKDAKSKDKVAAELAAIAQQKDSLFDDIYKESLNAAKGEMVDQAITLAIQQNSDSFDQIFAKTYELTITNIDGVFADLLSSGLFSLADSLEGDA